MDIQVGKYVFTDWKIVRKIGTGAAGVVYEICKENQGATLTAALKVLHIPEDPDMVIALRNNGLSEQATTNYLQRIVEELVEEIKIMISLKEFAYVVKCEDFFVEKNPNTAQWTVGIRMELLESLANYRKGHDITEEDVHRMAVHLTKALVLLDDRNIIHRDIKPENIFVNPYGDFKLGDFGIAKVYDQTSGHLSQKGTQSYMAPEVFHGQDYDKTVDIYSLGLVLYKFLNKNRLPFLPVEGEFAPIDWEMALASRLSGKKTIPAPVCGSGEFKDVILKMCANSPEDRYHNAKQLLKDLEAIRPSNDIVLASESNEVPQPDDEDSTSGNKSNISETRPNSEQSIGQQQIERSPDNVNNVENNGLNNALNGETNESPRPERQYTPAKDDIPTPTPTPWYRKKGVLMAVAAVVIILAIVIPIFMSQEYALVVKGGNGSGNYKAGAVVTVDADVIEGKTFVRWMATGIEISDEEAVNAEIVVSMPRHKAELTAQYNDSEHTVNVDSGSGSGQYIYGSEVTVVADTPENGYAFKGWEVKEGTIDTRDLTEQEVSFTMPDSDVELAAVYEPLTYRLKVNGAEGSGKYTFGNEVELEAGEQEHATFSRWVVEEGELSLSDEEAGDTDFVFTMPASNVTLKAEYKMNEHQVTVIKGEGTGTYKVDDTVEIKASTEETGMAFESWRVAKGKVTLDDSSIAETTFTMPDQDVEVEAQFIPRTYSLTVENGTGSGTYTYGESITINAENKTGYEFRGWNVTEGSITLDNEAVASEAIQFTMPACDVHIVAAYIQNTPEPTPVPTPSPIPSPTPSPIPPAVRVSGVSAQAIDKIVLRTGPSTSYMEIYTLLPEESLKATFVAIAKERGNKRDWVLVEYGFNGMLWRGYALADQFNLNGKVSEAKYSSDKQTIQNMVRVYSAPYEIGASRGILKPGDVITILQSDGEYYYIEYYEDEMGKTSRGYVNKRALNGEIDEAILPSGNYRVVNCFDGIKLKNAPWTVAQDIPVGDTGLLPVGSELYLYEESANQYAHVMWNGIDAYAPVYFLEQIR